MKAFICDWCGDYKYGYSKELTIMENGVAAYFDLCDKCQKELLEKLREIK